VTLRRHTRRMADSTQGLAEATESTVPRSTRPPSRPAPCERHCRHVNALYNSVMSPCVTNHIRSVRLAGRWARPGGHQPQSRHQALLRENVERVPLRCAELHHRRAERCIGRRGPSCGRRRDAEEDPDHAVATGVSPDLAAVTVDDHSNSSRRWAFPTPPTLRPPTDSLGRTHSDQGHGPAATTGRAAPAARPRTRRTRPACAPTRPRRGPRWPPPPDGPRARQRPGHGSRRRPAHRGR